MRWALWSRDEARRREMTTWCVSLPGRWRVPGRGLCDLPGSCTVLIRTESCGALGDVFGDVAVPRQQLSHRVRVGQQVDAVLRCGVAEPIEQCCSVVEVAFIPGGMQLHRQ